MKVIFYETPRCATNARQRQLLEAEGHDVLARNLLSEPWTAQRLRELTALEIPDTAGDIEGCSRIRARH
jgi:arsenate reductase-like glutaredoxin family protein